MIAFVKDIMIYIFVIAAVIIVPMKLGGYGAIFDAAGEALGAEGRRAGKVTAGLPLAPRRSGPSSRWRSARRWRCSCIRIR